MFPYSRSASAGVSNIADCGPNRLLLLTLGTEVRRGMAMLSEKPKYMLRVGVNTTPQN